MLKFIAEKISTHLLSKLMVTLTPTLVAAAIFFRNEITDQVKQSTPQTLAMLLVALAWAV